MCPSYRKWTCYWYNPKYYESGRFDVDIITHRFEIILTLWQRGTCKETTRKTFKVIQRDRASLLSNTRLVKMVMNGQSLASSFSTRFYLVSNSFQVWMHFCNSWISVLEVSEFEPGSRPCGITISDIGYLLLPICDMTEIQRVIW